MFFDFTEKFFPGQRIYDLNGASYIFEKGFMFDTGVGFDWVADCVNEQTGLKCEISETLLTSVAPKQFQR